MSDITAASIIDRVYDVNSIDQYCGRDLFKGGFFVEQQSAGHGLLETEYQAKLANPRLTAADGERLQNEYRSRRASIPLQYRLVFNAVGSCQSIPRTLVAKSLSDVLSTWDYAKRHRAVWLPPDNAQNCIRMPTPIPWP